MAKTLPTEKGNKIAFRAGLLAALYQGEGVESVFVRWASPEIQARTLKRHLGGGFLFKNVQLGICLAFPLFYRGGD